MKVADFSDSFQLLLKKIAKSLQMGNKSFFAWKLLCFTDAFNIYSAKFAGKYKFQQKFLLTTVQNLGNYLNPVTNQGSMLLW